jgi:hypothetical protein
MCAQQCWLLPDGCCCLNNTGNKILFRINWPRVNQGLNVAPCEEVHWCDVRWPGRQGHWPASFNPAIVVSGGEMLILKRMLFPLSLRHQELDIFERTRQSLLGRCRLCIEVGDSVLEHLL